jgi:hypothetical protein
MKPKDYSYWYPEDDVRTPSLCKTILLEADVASIDQVTTLRYIIQCQTSITHLLDATVPYSEQFPSHLSYCRKPIVTTLDVKDERLEGKTTLTLRQRNKKGSQRTPLPVLSERLRHVFYLCRSKRQYTAGGASPFPLRNLCPPTHLGSIKRHLFPG